MSADFWLNLQMRWDLYKANESEKQDIEDIHDFHHLQKLG
jgi:plasmid maintenance system antidote protein VapI